MDRKAQAASLPLHLFREGVMKSCHRQLVRWTVSLCVFLCVPALAQAQSFPSNPIRILVPTAPSTPPDIISRVIASELSESEGWRVVVENKPGAVQTIAGSE